MPLVWTSCATSDIMEGSAQMESNGREGQKTPGAVPSWLMPGAFCSAPLELPQASKDDEDDEEVGHRFWAESSIHSIL